MLNCVLGCGEISHFGTVFIFPIIRATLDSDFQENSEIDY